MVPLQSKSLAALALTSPCQSLQLERMLRISSLTSAGSSVSTVAGRRSMTNTTPKRPRDPNQLAKSIIDIATGEKPDRDPTPEEQGKDPAAVALGKKGGKARADSMTAEKRSEIAKRAAESRWIKK